MRRKVRRVVRYKADGRFVPSRYLERTKHPEMYTVEKFPVYRVARPSFLDRMRSNVKAFLWLIV